MMPARSEPLTLPQVPLSRALQRVSAIWHPEAIAHQFIVGMTGSGKTTLAQAILTELCADERLVTFEPKQNDDPVWNGPDSDPDRYGRVVTTLRPKFGFEGEPGGGPGDTWFRLQGSPDRADTARRFEAAMKVIEAEGHCVVLLDDVVAICRELGCAERVRSMLNLGRSAGILAIMSSTETSYVEGRNQAGIRWLGSTSGLTMAKAGAAMLDKSGRTWWEACAKVEPRQWLYADSGAGNAGVALVMS